MSTRQDQSPAKWLTTTQLGAVGEAVIATGLLLASNGRFSPFKPFADDGGIDLLLFDKLTKKAFPLQVKSRTKLDDPKAGTVQFDVQLSTFTREGGGYLLAAYINGAEVKTAWLIPADVLESASNRKADKLVIVASTKPNSNDRYRRFRYDSLGPVAEAISKAFVTPTHLTASS